eukprot:gene13571-14939_t
MKELREKIRHYLEQVTASPELRLSALDQIVTLADNDSYKEILCDPSLNLLPIVRDLLYESIGQMDGLCSLLTRILWYLSRNQTCCVIISSSKVGILSVLIKILTEVPNIMERYYFNGMMNIFINMSLAADCHFELVRPELGLLSYLRSFILTHHNDVRPVVVLSNFLLTTKSENVPMVVYTDVMNILMDRLARGGVDPTIWHQRHTGMTSWCLNFFTNLSYFPMSHDVIRNLDQFTFFYTSCQTGTIEGMKATVIIGNVYCGDNKHLVNRLLAEHEFIIPLLVDIFDYGIRYNRKRDVVMNVEAMGFQYGETRLRAVISALKNLSIGNENKAAMLKEETRLLSLTLTAIDDFNNDIDYYGVYLRYGVETMGGGGRDFELLQLLLELLIQLSFYYENDSSLQEAYERVPDLNATDILQRLLALPVERNVPVESKHCAALLLSRLL